MFPHIAHLYGPIWIQSYGFMIAVGLLIFLYFSINHPQRKKIISKDLYINGVFFGLLCGVAGGRLLYALSYPAEFTGRWHELFLPWIGGLTVIGAIIGVLIGGFWYLKRHHIPVLPLFDLVALFAPLMHAISRLGCFAAGCCYGAPAAALLWAVTFINPDAHAPLFIPLHPTQLYASAASAITFSILFFLQKRLLKNPGIMLCSFLMLENIARFILDFWRGDRDPIIGTIGSLVISQVQMYSVVGLLCTIAGLLWLLSSKKP